MPHVVTEARDTEQGPVRSGLAWRDALVIVASFAAAGAVAGVLWEWVWTPPSGLALEHKWVLDNDGLLHSFTGTGTYVVVASLVGIVGGALAGLFFDRSEILTLASVVVGGLLAGWVMQQVGGALGPPDPRPIAATAKDYTPIPANLEVSGRSAWVVFPGGALLGLIVVLLGLTGRRRSAVRSPAGE